MEYFDPKTRPAAIFLDDTALRSAPIELIRATATTVFASVVGSRAETRLNPLAQGDQDMAFRLAHEAYLRLMNEIDNPELRRNLGLAAFLQNRAEDAGRRRYHTSVFAGNYAVSTALHIRYPSIGQGEATSVVHGHAIRLAEEVPFAAARQVAESLAVWRDGMDSLATADAVAGKLEEIYHQVVITLVFVCMHYLHVQHLIIILLLVVMLYHQIQLEIIILLLVMVL